MSTWEGRNRRYEFKDSPISFGSSGGGGRPPWENTGAIFILSRNDGQGTDGFSPLLIEETDDLLGALNRSEYTGCARGEGLTHVHWIYSLDRGKRESIKRDLLNYYGGTPCNR